MSTTPYVLGALAAVAALKALWRPHRAVVREGAVARCPGGTSYGSCDPTLQISAPAGAHVYSTAQGHVVAVGPDWLHIAASHEPVVLYYDGVTPEVGEGQYVGRGQTIGASTGRTYFGVTQFSADGSENIDPSSWLASRGQKIAAKYTGPGTSWCEQGRHIQVPQAAGSACDLQEPDRPHFALLPVTVDIQR